MAKFPMPKIIRPLKLADYAPEYGDASIQIWVNPPKEVRDRRFDLLGEFVRKDTDFKAAKKTKAEIETQATWQKDWKARWTGWLAHLWSQSPDPAQHWTQAEIEEMDATDPALVRWLIQQTLEMVDNPKKALTTA